MLVGREKLNAVRAEIRAIEKVGLAKEVHEQKLREAQDIADAVLDAEVRMGELTAKIPKASGGDRRSDDFKNRNGAEFEKGKTAVLKEIGVKPDTAERFEQLAKHPDIVEKAKAKAREKGEIVTRQSALDEIHDVVVGKNKSPAQSKREFLNEVKQEHRDFKESQVVSVKDIRRDKENLRVLASERFVQILKACKQVSNIAIDEKIDGIPFTDLVKEMSEDDVSSCKNSISRAINTLHKTLEVLTG